MNKELKKILKEIETYIDLNYISIKTIQKEIQKLEKERNVLIRNRTDRVYDNYKIDEIIKVINIKIDTLKEILEKCIVKI